MHSSASSTSNQATDCLHSRPPLICIRHAACNAATKRSKKSTLPAGKQFFPISITVPVEKQVFAGSMTIPKRKAQHGNQKGSGQKGGRCPFSTRPLWQGHGEGCGKDCCQSCTRKNCGGQTGCKDHRYQACQQNRWHCRRQEARSRQDSREDRGRQAGWRQEACSQEVSCRQGPCARSCQACCQSSPQGCGQARCQEGTGPQGLMTLPLRTHRVGAQCVGISHIQVDP